MIRAWVFLCVGASTAAVAAQPLGLGGAFEAASRHDPVFQAAVAELEAAQQAVPLARAALRPSVSATFTEARVEGSRELPGLAGPVRSPLDYRAPNHALSVRIPLLNPEARARERHALAQFEQAQRLHEARRVDLLDRVAVAWLDTIRAEGQWRWAGDPVQSARVQLEQARQRLRDGEGTRVEVAEAEAAVATSRAAEDGARDGVSRARLALAQLTGQKGAAEPAGAVPAAPEWPAAASWAAQGPGLEEWVGLAWERSPVLAARRAAVQVAQAGAQRAEAGHLPRMEAVLSASTTRNESVGTLGQGVNQRVMSAQLNVPLYSGGQVMASVAQAAAELRRVQSELEAERQALQREVTRQFLLRADQARRHAAQQGVVAAAALALRGAESALDGGQASLGEVAQARRRLAQERQALDEIEAAGWLAWIRLQALSGEQPERVALGVDAAWVHAAANASRPQAPAAPLR